MEMCWHWKDVIFPFTYSVHLKSQTGNVSIDTETGTTILIRAYRFTTRRKRVRPQKENKYIMFLTNGDVKDKGTPPSVPNQTPTVQMSDYSLSHSAW